MIAALLRFALGSRLRVLDADAALGWLEATGKSLVRWGDGETAVHRGQAIPFQDASPELRQALATVLAQQRPDIAVGIPAGAVCGPLLRHATRRGWLRTRLLWARHARPEATYVDAFLFRDRPEAALSGLKAMAGRRDWIVVVSSNGNDAGLFSDLAVGVGWIGIPARNAFGDFEAIVAAIKAEAARLDSERDTNKGNGLVLIAAGPTAKALVLELSPALRCLDVGHLFYFQRHGAKRNVWAG